MKLTLIAAIADNGVIGNAGKIPWHISADLQRFKRVTMGHPVIMGRKTFESLGKPLPGRRNIVLTRQAGVPGVECFSDLDSALQHLEASRCDLVFVIGGAEVYRQTLPLADRLLITHVRQEAAGDTKFPEYDRAAWREVSRETLPECVFVEYVRCTD